APVFLWPVFVQIDLHRQGRVRIGRAAEQKTPLPPQFNRPMAQWVQRQFGFQLPEYSDPELSEFNLEAIDQELQRIAGAFHPGLSMMDCEAPLQPVPSPKTLDPKQSPRFYNSAVMGYFRWQNEAILADLEALRNKEDCAGVAGGFVSG